MIRILFDGSEESVLKIKEHIPTASLIDESTLVIPWYDLDKKIFIGDTIIITEAEDKYGVH